MTRKSKQNPSSSPKINSKADATALSATDLEKVVGGEEVSFTYGSIRPTYTSQSPGGTSTK